MATLLAEAAADAPGRPALLHDGQRIVYAELDTLAARSAGALRDRGVGPGDRVALALPNRPDFVAAYHGALRLGAIVVPINPLLSEREQHERIADAGARVVVSGPLDGAPVDGVAGITGDDVAVVLYSSGTTGSPKRIELTHAGLRLNAEYVAYDALQLRKDDVLFGSAPLAHVFAMTGCMNAALAARACLALVERFEPHAALDLIEHGHVTVFMGVPAMCVALLATGRGAPLRLAHIGGAPLAVETLHAFEERFGTTVLEGYGMTEVGGMATSNHAGRERKPGTVGTPAAGGEVRIESDGTGEVLLLSPTIMRGHDGWLATGDVGYVDDDGYLHLVDRKKDVILRGGYSVYPREIEEVLFAHPHVYEAVVVGVPDERLGEEVVALVVPADPACDPVELQAYARERVAAYAYPRRVVLVDDFPRSATGKILRREIDREALRTRT
ncbi:MAG TPA: AMP-binding protein [Gaiellaceae bacterium]|nr:AMP-binding protein [Gaiellaceae bacterium]